MVNNKAIRQALYERLNVPAVTTLLANGSASLIHAVAQPNADYPLVIFHKQAGTPTHQMGGSHYDTQVWLVKAIVRGGSSSQAEDIADAAADRLDFGFLAITGGQLMSLIRQSDVDYTETDGDQVYRHHGALYRVQVQNA